MQKLVAQIIYFPVILLSNIFCGEFGVELGNLILISAATFALYHHPINIEHRLHKNTTYFDMVLEPQATLVVLSSSCSKMLRSIHRITGCKELGFKPL